MTGSRQTYNMGESPFRRLDILDERKGATLVMHG